MKADPETEAAVLATVGKLIDGLARKDPETVLSLYAPDAVALGSGRDEKRLGLDQIRVGLERDLEQAGALEVKQSWAHVVARESTAWLATEGEIQWKVGGSESRSQYRFTVVLERRSGRWLWVQTHFSFPAPDQPEGRSWPTPIEAIAAAVSEERPDLRSQAAPDGTVTMLFTDIENSTVLTERLGDTQWLDVLREHNAIVREQAKAHDCFEVKSQGDGFMIASQSARRAVHCAIGIQQGLSHYNETAPEPIHVRMGLHTGEVLKDADDFFGKHVILASRIAGKARGGEILASALLKELTESAGDIKFGETRQVELKGLSGTHLVHEVAWQP